MADQVSSFLPVFVSVVATVSAAADVPPYLPSPVITSIASHRKTLTSRDAYQFFAGLDSAGSPRWSSDVDQREPHFTDPAGVEGVQVVYHAAIHRYLLTAHRGDQGTLGLFDAPEPWGPWTTIAYDDNWLELQGTGMGREMLFINIPTKWIGDHGKTLWAVFTGGRDRFMLVEGVLTLREDER